MPNHLRLSSEQAKIPPRKGKRGYVRVHVDVPPEQKDRLVTEAHTNICSMSDVIRDALDFYFDGIG